MLLNRAATALLALLAGPGGASFVASGDCVAQDECICSSNYVKQTHHMA